MRFLDSADGTSGNFRQFFFPLPPFELQSSDDFFFLSHNIRENTPEKSVAGGGIGGEKECRESNPLSGLLIKYH